MKVSQESIFSSALRSFFSSLFTVIGFFAALIPLLIFIAIAFGGNPREIPSATTPIFLPNAQGERELLSKESPVILQIDIHGPIGSDVFRAEHVRQQLQDSREGVFANNRVKGLFLNINTPGGTVFDADSIYRAILDYKKKYDLPVYAYVDGLCASGGMYIASAADKIVASDVSLVGSVGVLLQFMNFSETLDKVGVKAHTLTYGKNKDLMNPMRPWAEDEDKTFKMIANNYYEMFVDIVTKGRPKIDKDDLVNIYGANVYPAKEALRYGFIDDSGYEREEALQELVEELNLGEKDYQVVKLQRRNWISGILAKNSLLRSGKVEHKVSHPLSDLMLSNQYLYLYAPGKI